MKLSMFTATFALCAMLGSGGIANTYRSVSPDELFDLIRDRVDTLEVDTSGGDTTLEGRIEGRSFQVYFYECDGGSLTDPAKRHSACLGFEYRSYFNDRRKDTRTINQWNADHHYGKMFLDDDGDLAVQLNVIVEGGITDNNIRTTLAWWRAVVQSAEDD